MTSLAPCSSPRLCRNQAWLSSQLHGGFTPDACTSAPGDPSIQRGIRWCLCHPGPGEPAQKGAWSVSHRGATVSYHRGSIQLQRGSPRVVLGSLLTPGWGLCG